MRCLLRFGLVESVRAESCAAPQALTRLQPAYQLVDCCLGKGANPWVDRSMLSHCGIGLGQISTGVSYCHTWQSWCRVVMTRRAGMYVATLLGIEQLRRTIEQCAPRRETFRTVHDVTEETARVLQASVVGLRALERSGGLQPRARMMLATLARERARTEHDLWVEAFRCKSSPVGQTQLQYAPVFVVAPGLAKKIWDAPSAQDAYEAVCESDGALLNALERLSEGSPGPKVYLQQLAAVVKRLRRTCQGVFLGANDI